MTLDTEGQPHSPRMPDEQEIAFWARQRDQIKAKRDSTPEGPARDRLTDMLASAETHLPKD